MTRIKRMGIGGAAREIFAYPCHPRNPRSILPGQKSRNASRLEWSDSTIASMIRVENLTKRYAGHTAIKDLSFEVGKGEIMGFLGPNGAGKSTPMRILSSFMPPTSGRASIAG